MFESFPFIAATLASMLHVITGPDHLAAVTPFAIEAKRKAWKVGTYWAGGHLLGMLLLGGLFYWFREVIPIDSISRYAEKIVGAVLVGIGVWALFKLLYKERNHRHLHIHDGNNPVIHKHDHDHSHGSNHDHSHDDLPLSGLAPAFYIGTLHGIAGIGHILLFIPVLGFKTNSDSLTYLGGFGLGIIMAMALYAMVIGRISTLAGNGHGTAFFSGIRLSAGIFAIVVGLYWFFTN
ncbi:MAG: nickel transporter [Flavobacteriaceae bacterium]|nr:nickel transporter [Flavobacteriaceae bacterium]